MPSARRGISAGTTLAQGSVDPILRHDFSTLEEYVNTLLKKENIVYVIFTDRMIMSSQGAIRR